MTVSFFNTSAWALREVLEERNHVAEGLLAEIASRPAVAPENEIDYDDDKHLLLEKTVKSQRCNNAAGIAQAFLLLALVCLP